MRPWKTLKGTLVHPKDELDKEDITECVYKVPGANCDILFPSMLAMSYVVIAVILTIFQDMISQLNDVTCFSELSCLMWIQLLRST